MKHVFISHAQANADFAELLHGELEAKGMTAWLANDIKSGDDWRQSIDDAIKSSFAVVVVISPEADQSKYVTYEWAFAYGIGIQIVPVLYQSLKTGNKIHPRLETLQYEDFTQKNNRPWKKLIERLLEIQQKVTSKEQSDPRVIEAISALNGWRSSDRIEAARALGRFKANSAVPSLIITLQDQDIELQLASAQALGEIGDSQAAESLSSKFTDLDSNLRKTCATALRKIDEPSFGEHFIKLLNDRNCEIRIIAIKALHKFQTKSATNKLLDLLIKLADGVVDCYEDEDDEFQEDVSANQLLESVTDALKYLVDESSIATLKKLVNDDNESDIRQSAITLLGCIKHTDAFNFLFELLIQSDPNLRDIVLTALAQQTHFSTIKELFISLHSDDSEIYQNSINEINQIAGVKGLFGALGDPQNNAYWAICRKLNEIIANDDYPSIKLAFQSESSRIRGFTAEIIKMKEYKDFCEELKSLIDDENAFVRGVAIRAIGDLKCGGSVRKLQVKLKDEAKVFGKSEITVAEHTAIALAKLGNASAIPTLISILLYSSSTDLTSEARELLSSLNDKAAISQLINQLRSDEMLICEIASDALQNAINKSHLSELFELLRDEFWYVRFTSARILGNLNDKTAIDALSESLNDEDSDVRSASATSLGLIGDASVVPILIEKLSDASPCIHLGGQVSEYVEEALEAIGTPEANQAVANSRNEKSDEEFDDFDPMGDIPF